MSAVSGAMITTLLLRTCNLTTIACGRWSPVINQGEVARRSCWTFKLLALCLSNNNNHSRENGNLNDLVDKAERILHFLRRNVYLRKIYHVGCLAWLGILLASRQHAQLGFAPLPSSGRGLMSTPLEHRSQLLFTFLPSTSKGRPQLIYEQLPILFF